MCMLRLLVSANIVPFSPIPVTLIMEAIHSSETSVPTGTTRHHMPEDDILRTELNYPSYPIWYKLPSDTDVSLRGSNSCNGRVHQITSFHFIPHFFIHSAADHSLFIWLPLFCFWPYFFHQIFFPSRFHSLVEVNLSYLLLAIWRQESIWLREVSLLATQLRH
jgi:hypothetical protein